ncbi:hypothetical protein LPJ61_006545, partial [Coemansia biformis]
LEQDQVTFDWELLADTLQVPLTEVFEAVSSLFEKHMGRPLAMGDESIQFAHQLPAAAERGLSRQTAEMSSGSTEVPGQGSAVRGGAGELELGSESEPESNHGRVSEQALAGRGGESPLVNSSAGSAEIGHAGMRSVESLGMTAPDEPQSPAVELSSLTPRAGSSSDLTEEIRPATEEQRAPQPTGKASESSGGRPIEPRLARRLRDSGQQRVSGKTPEHVDMRQSMLADAIGSQMLPDRSPAPAAEAAAATTAKKNPLSSSSSSFSDLSSSSLTESAMQDALIAEAMNASTMSSLLGSRMFPWSKKR